MPLRSRVNRPKLATSITFPRATHQGKLPTGRQPETGEAPSLPPHRNKPHSPRPRRPGVSSGGRRATQSLFEIRRHLRESFRSRHHGIFLLRSHQCFYKTGFFRTTPSARQIVIFGSQKAVRLRDNVVEVVLVLGSQAQLINHRIDKSPRGTRCPIFRRSAFRGLSRSFSGSSSQPVLVDRPSLCASCLSP